MGNCCGTKTLGRCYVTAFFSCVRSNAVLQLYAEFAISNDIANEYHCISVTLYATGKAKVKVAKSLVLSEGIMFLAILC